MDAVTLQSRRDVLRMAGGLAATLLFGPGAAAAAKRGERTISLYAVSTGEHLTVDYFADGAYRPDALRAVNRLLRDHVTDEVHSIDPSLLDQLCMLRRLLGSRDPYHVVCGYRCPQTNALKRRRGRSGVAEQSFHVEGRAIDLFVPDRGLRDVRGAALTLAAGGVGYYPRSGFVHVDTGPVRTW